MKNKILLLIMLAVPSLLFSQEIVTGLFTNPVIKNYYKHNQKKKPPKNDSISLPFKDDFSYRSIFPDSNLWSNKYVFINSSYAYMPPTIGVATFDALNDTGAIYANANSTGFIADSLTSKPLKMAGLKKSDSVYFSFFYQPQGTGNAPEAGDSLVLEFYSPATGQWNHIWSSPGMTLLQFDTARYRWFKPVIISITDSASYFQNGFRFCFYNYASLANSNYPTWAGNVDQWNIDYVYLDKNRTRGDTIFYDVAFMDPAPSMLKNYQSMPWSQYKVNAAAEMKDSLHLSIANLDTTILQNDFQYEVFDQANTPVHTFSGGTCNIRPYWQFGPQISQKCWAHATPPVVGFTFPTSAADSARFQLVLSLKMGAGDNLRANDTTIFNQLFYDYYAYDDGTAEAGYGLSPGNSSLAYKFTLNQPDTLRAIKMFFNQTMNNASQQTFFLKIWKDAGGYPGDTLYQQQYLMPEYADSLNKFYNYRLTRPVPVTGTFYVGWLQLDDVNLNLGFDMNNDEHSKIFYNIGGGWTKSMYNGALMIRPVIGKPLPLMAGLANNSNIPGEIKVFPNPSSGELISVVLPKTFTEGINQLSVRIFDILGNEVYNASYTENINVSALQNGIYLLTVTSKNKASSYFAKLCVVK